MAKEKTIKVVNRGGPAGGIYFLAFIGAAIYFVSVSEGFWGFILAVLKALVWPAFLVNKIFELLRL